jgi:hypothetical protein
MIDDFGLLTAEAIIAENVPQDVNRQTLRRSVEQAG